MMCKISNSTRANAQLTGKKWLAKISERSEQKTTHFLSLLNFLLGFFSNNPFKNKEYY
jgi:hypothetical protein